LTGEQLNGGATEFAASLSVFFPAFNDAPSLPGLLRATFETLRARVTDFEVIVINDGSSDATAQVLIELEEQYAPHLRVVTHERNLGYGAALRSGFLAATKDYVFYTDGDGQYDPSELAQLLKAAEPDVALVNGYKTQRHDPWHRIAIGWLYNRFARWLFRIHLRDIDCDFRLIKRSAFEPASLQSTGGTICVELVRSLELSSMRVVELPVSHFARQHGRSQFFRLRSLATTFLQLMLVFWRLVLWPPLSSKAARAMDFYNGIVEGVRH
jgi:glycosyltransferase involved in cell wall biosynthesis